MRRPKGAARFATARALVTNAEAERDGYTNADDTLNVMLDNGRRVRIIDTTADRWPAALADLVSRTAYAARLADLESAGEFVPPAAYAATLHSRGPPTEPSIPVALVPRAHGVHVLCLSFLASKAGQHGLSPSSPTTSRLVLAATPSAKLRCGRASSLRRVTTARSAATLQWV